MFTLCGFCFLENTILLLGRNIGTTMLLQGLGATAMPYVLIAVGVIVLTVSPIFSKYGETRRATDVMSALSLLAIAIVSSFGALFYLDIAPRYPRVLYPIFYVLEEVLVTLMMLTFWQIAMLSLTKDEAKRLIGLVSMGAALGSLCNGIIVGVIVRYAPGGSYAIAPLQCVLILLKLLPNARVAQHYLPRQLKRSNSVAAMNRLKNEEDKLAASPGPQPQEEEESQDWSPASRRPTATAPMAEEAPAAAPATPPPSPPSPAADGATAAELRGGSMVQPSSEPWWKNPTTRLLAQWAFFIVIVFVCIEFQYNAVVAASMGADGIAEINGMLASFAGIGQTFSNLLLTPFLLQMRGGVGYALLVTPLAAMCGEVLLVSFQSVPTAFIVRSFDFIFRYTINDSAKNIIFQSLPPRDLLDARAFIDGTLKKGSPALVGLLLIGAQHLFDADAGAEVLVRPLGICLLVWICVLLPLTAKLARQHAKQTEEHEDALLKA